MPRYMVARAYYSEHNGRRFGPYKPGTQVELTEPDAQWVNRDSPGALEPVGGKQPRTEPKAPQPPVGKRQSRKPKEA